MLDVPDRILHSKSLVYNDLRSPLADHEDAELTQRDLENLAPPIEAGPLLRIASPICPVLLGIRTFMVRAVIGVLQSILR
jgi:hypothetical protein